MIKDVHTRFTIITVCLNSADLMRTTFESILAQDYTDIQYIVQDGGSDDDTGDVIHNFEMKFRERGIEFVFNEGPDKGIYDAMNKAGACATGDYINYMNAGDCFYSDHVLTDVAKVIADSSYGYEDRPTIVYGDCAVYEYGRFYRFSKSLDNIDEAMPFSHQSVFAKFDYVMGHPFDTDLRYSADYDFLLTAYDLGRRFVDADTFVCITTADGTSSVNYHDTLMESVRIRKAHNRFHHSDRDLAKMERSLKIKQFVLNHFPLCIKKLIRQIQISKRGQSLEFDVPGWCYFTKE